jgi:hypothetical protein
MRMTMKTNDKKKPILKRELVKKQLEARLRRADELNQLRNELRAKYGEFPSSVEYIRMMREGKI